MPPPGGHYTVPGYNPSIGVTGSPASRKSGAQYAEEAAAGQRLNAQNILSQIRNRDQTAAAALLSAQASMKNVGINADQVRENARQFDLTDAEGRRQFNLTFGLSLQKFELEQQRVKLEGAQTILNAPRGPADFFAYASRLPSVANAGGSFLGNLFGQALSRVSGESLGQLQQGGVLSNSQFATDLVKASRGESVSDATSTFLRRSLGVNVPGETQVAQQQAQQAAQAAAAPPAASAPAAPVEMGPTQIQLASARYGDPGVPAGAVADLGAHAGWFMPDGTFVPTNFSGVGNADQAVDDWLMANIGDPTRGGGGRWFLHPSGKAEWIGAQAAGITSGPTISPPGTMAPIGQTNITPGGGGSGVLDAILGGGRSFLERLGGLALPTGFQTSIQEYNRLEPSAQAMYTGLLGETGIQTPDDFLAGLVKAAPTFASSRTARLR